ncbi:alpha/beta fold hydrolase [Elioraea sp.]|uniref:alpha/beta fold hydrolase n=1 Tax=Elioraea sp. TaxID=2185103 RepID=UPI003F728891
MRDWTLPDIMTFEGRTVRYRVAGNGPPIVLMHGTPFSSVVWRRIAPLLAETRRVFCYDMLGYGQSEMRDGDDVSLGVQNRLFAALLSHWGIGRPDVVAHDFGGATALRAHLLDRRDYRSLTLIDPVAVRPWGSPLVHHVRDHQAAFAGMPAYMHEAILPAYLRSAMQQPATDAVLAPLIAPWLGEVGQAAFYRQIAQMDQRFTDEVEPLYGAIRCPAQILWGEDDQWIPIAQGRRLAAMISGARFMPVPDCGHLMQHDAPEAILHALAGFLPSA